ncbi:MAG: squalene/phytoene synthase family protein [Rubrimonas sp.]|uniref:squalene/phytoene synthase family protein n=1 Tax=Rubrimonas sp. TaxID=2036015 RepID=UPI002FDDB7CD
MSAPALDPVADLVRRGDPDRFLSAMTAPEPGRSRLMALYAFNLELARAPFAVSEPMLARIRLQWWREALEEGRAGRPRRHEVAEPLAAAIAEAGAPQEPFERLISAWERAVDAPPEGAALAGWLRDTGAPVLSLAARMLAPEGADALAEPAGFAFAAAAWARAAPALGARGWSVPPAKDAQALARAALAELAQARSGRGAAPKAATPAFAAGWLAAPTLRAASRPDFDPMRGPPEPSPFRRRAGLLWVAATGGW